MNYKDVLKAGEDYTSLLNEFLDSGQLPENGNKFEEKAQSAIYEIEQASKELEAIFTPKPTKKANLVTGELRIHTGIFDFKESAVFQIQIFNRIIALGIENTKEEFALWLEKTYNIKPEDILINYWNIHTTNDTLSMTFAFQTDLDFETPRNDISLIVGKRAQGGGYFNQNKAFIRNNGLETIPISIYQWPLKGFALPYSFIADIPELVNAMRMSADNNGDLADLRAFSQTYTYLINPFIEELKAKRWNQIFTQWGKWKLNADGIYRKY